MSYRAQTNYWGTKTAGFLLAPAVVGVTAGALTSKATGQPIDATTGVLIAGGTAALLWYASENVQDVTLQAFARGGAWGAIVGLALLPVTTAIAAKR